MDNGAFDGQPAFTNGAIAVGMYADATAYAMSVSNVVVTPLVFNPNYTTTTKHRR